jgi:hypothetical protein
MGKQGGGYIKDCGLKAKAEIMFSPQYYQILINSMESGYGIVTAMHQINE